MLTAFLLSTALLSVEAQVSKVKDYGVSVVKTERAKVWKDPTGGMYAPTVRAPDGQEILLVTLRVQGAGKVVLGNLVAHVGGKPHPSAFKSIEESRFDAEGKESSAVFTFERTIPFVIPEAAAVDKLTIEGVDVHILSARGVAAVQSAARGRLPAAAQDQDRSQGLFVRYMDPISGAAVLLRRLLPHDEAVRLLEQVRTAEGPGSAVRTWKSGADVEPPIDAGSPLSCRFTDIRSGLTLSTDCQPTFEDVTAWMQLEPDPGKTRSVCCSPLHTERLFGLLSRSGVIAIGPYVQRDGGSIQVWAGRGRLRESDGPSFVTVSARDGRTGRTLVLDASRMTDETTKTHLEALNAATTLKEMVDVVRAGGPSGVVAAEGTLSANSSRLRVLIRRGDAVR